MREGESLFHPHTNPATAGYCNLNMMIDVSRSAITPTKTLAMWEHLGVYIDTCIYCALCVLYIVYASLCV